MWDILLAKKNLAPFDWLKLPAAESWVKSEFALVHQQTTRLLQEIDGNFNQCYQIAAKLVQKVKEHTVVVGNIHEELQVSEIACIALVFTK